MGRLFPTNGLLFEMPGALGRVSLFMCARGRNSGAQHAWRTIVSDRVKRDGGLEARSPTQFIHTH